MKYENQKLNDLLGEIEFVSHIINEWKTGDAKNTNTIAKCNARVIYLAKELKCMDELDAIHERAFYCVFGASVKYHPIAKYSPIFEDISFNMNSIRILFDDADFIPSIFNKFFEIVERNVEELREHVCNIIAQIGDVSDFRCKMLRVDGPGDHVHVTEHDDGYAVYLLLRIGTTLNETIVGTVEFEGIDHFCSELKVKEYFGGYSHEMSRCFPILIKHFPEEFV